MCTVWLGGRMEEGHSLQDKEAESKGKDIYMSNPGGNDALLPGGSQCCFSSMVLVARDSP